MATKTEAPETLFRTTTILTTIITTRITATITITNKTVAVRKEGHELLSHPVRHVGKQTTPQKDGILEPTQPIDRLPDTDDRNDRIRSKNEQAKAIRRKLLKLQPKM